MIRVKNGQIYHADCHSRTDENMDLIEPLRPLALPSTEVVNLFCPKCEKLFEVIEK